MLGTKEFWNRLVPMQDALSQTFFALADPTRRAILDRLAKGEASVAELAVPFQITPRAVSKHVAVLEAAGLVVRRKSAQRRPTQLRLQPLAEVDRWLSLYRQMWENRFARLEERLEQKKDNRTDD
jgi:DNA-binding transcriptional ArsR family regulator